MKKYANIIDLQSDGDEAEKRSPFYLKNEQICFELADYIAQKEGKLKGVYGAWSYHVISKIESPVEAVIEIKKASYSSGNLLLSTEYQSLYVSSTWKIRFNSNTIPIFTIYKVSFWNSIGAIFSTNVRRLQGGEKLFVRSKDHDRLKRFLNSFSTIMDSNELYRMSFDRRKLELELRSKNLHLDFFDQLMQQLHTNSVNTS